MSTLTRYCIWIVQLPDYPHSQAFEDAAQTLSAAFAALGGDCPIYRVSQFSNSVGRIPIVLGAHLLSRGALNSAAIIYNTEQVGIETYAWASPAYDEALASHRVLDYSFHNAQALRDRGIDVQVLPLRGQPESATIVHLPENEKDIDVLFYGSMNERRREVINQISARGLTTKSLFNVYAAERDAAIARSKVVANVHYYDPAIFEIFRISHLLTNGVCVVSEGSDYDPDITPLSDGLIVTDYEKFSELCAAMCKSTLLRGICCDNARRVIAENTQADELHRLITNGTWSL